MKLSKSAKARLRRMTNAEKKAVEKAAILLADAEMITSMRCATILRTLDTSSYIRR